MYIVIAGSRGFNDYQLLENTLDRFLEDNPISAVISGTAAGADKLGEQWAKKRGIRVLRMPANWDRYGKSAGYRRNEEMAKIAEHVFAFWDGQSRGTKHMIDIARARHIRTSIVQYGGSIAKANMDQA